MSEPYLSTRDMLMRIEADLAGLRADVHSMQLAMAKSSATTIAESAAAAIDRAKTATWVAAGSAVAAGAAVVVAILKH